MCGRLVNLDTVARVIADYYHLKTDTQLAALDEALSKVPAVSVGGGHEKDHVADPGKMAGDLISRAVVVDAIEGVDWYHINKNGEMVHGANDAEHQAWYKADDIYAAIERVPSAQPGWIPCSTEMPPTEKDVLVTLEGGTVTDGERWEPQEGKWFLFGGGVNGLDEDVIAWMPLPNPYRPKGEEHG